jgi:chromosome segregation ATPase
VKFLKRKEEVRKLIDELNDSKEERANLSYKLSTKEQEITRLTEERDKWRAQFERAVHTPEYKLDAEAAFARGVSSARQKMGAWLVTTGQGILAEKVLTSDE